MQVSTEVIIALFLLSYQKPILVLSLKKTDYLIW